MARFRRERKIAWRRSSRRSRDPKFCRDRAAIPHLQGDQSEVAVVENVLAESVVRDIIGHESELVRCNYTHVDDATKRKAILNLPDISKVAGKQST